MREIKFRAYDKIDERLIIDKQDFIPLIVTNKGVFKLDPCCEYNRWIELEKDRFVLMQYTGLKDKNGKDVYEGDIVKYDFGGNNYKGFIEYKEARFQIRDKAFRNDLDYALNIEVIGNVYENPELLNKG